MVPIILEGLKLHIDVQYICKTYNYYQNATHTSLYFKYSHPDTLQVTIMGTRRMLIPEFAPEIVLPMFIIATLLAIIISKRKMRTYNSKTGWATDKTGKRWKFDVSGHQTLLVWGICINTYNHYLQSGITMLKFNNICRNYRVDSYQEFSNDISYGAHYKKQVICQWEDRN